MGLSILPKTARGKEQAQRWVQECTLHLPLWLRESQSTKAHNTARVSVKHGSKLILDSLGACAPTAASQTSQECGSVAM